jgi:hypothetical protein
VVVLAVLVSLGAAPRGASTPESLLREGNAAFESGDYARAVTLYEQAELRTTDPGQVAFNLATAKYHLGISEAGSVQTLREAEQLYRCCLTPGDPRRVRALYGVGNCLLARAVAQPSLDVASLRAAVVAYRQCQRLAGDDARLANDARQNLQRARLLLLQVSPESAPPEDSPGEDNHSPSTQPDVPGGAEHMDDRGEGKPDPDSGATPVKAKPGEKPIPTDSQPAPGAGKLPPVPEGGNPGPLSAREAASQIEQATRRILEERKAYRRSRSAPRPATGVKDW